MPQKNPKIKKKKRKRKKRLNSDDAIDKLRNTFIVALRHNYSLNKVYISSKNIFFHSLILHNFIRETL